MNFDMHLLARRFYLLMILHFIPLRSILFRIIMPCLSFFLPVSFISIGHVCINLLSDKQSKKRLTVTYRLEKILIEYSNNTAIWFVKIWMLTCEFHRLCTQGKSDCNFFKWVSRFHINLILIRNGPLNWSTFSILMPEFSLVWVTTYGNVPSAR